ncbi:serine hydrolase domain-containing protein [Croceiramulus getboli]|nr:serine hydrolase [Flavobacteriaceae bacterium YJPT1-3]
MRPLNYSLQRITIAFFVALLISSFYKMPDPQEVSSKKSLKISATTQPKLSPQARRMYLHRQEQLQVAVAEYFDKAIKKGLIVGAGVSIVKGDSIVLATGYGSRNLRTNKGVDAGTVFRLGSLSKGFAGVLAGKFKSEGLLDWNDKINEYVPELQFKQAHHTPKITLSHILSHTSGAPYHSYTDLIEHGVDLRTIASSFTAVQPVSAPGELYSYQNALFSMVGEATQQVTGNPIANDLKENFFTPLNMSTVSTDHEGLLATENKAIPHRKYRRGWRSIQLNDHYYNAVAAGGINASAADMAQWMRFLLGHNQEVMGAEALAEVFQPQVEIPGRSKYYQRWKGHQASYYAYGWRVHEFVDEQEKAQTMIHHGGSVNNFRNEIALFPEDDLGICVLMNSMTPLASRVIPDLQEIIASIYKENLTEEAVIAAN